MCKDKSDGECQTKSFVSRAIKADFGMLNTFVFLSKNAILSCQQKIIFTKAYWETLTNIFSCDLFY